MAASICSPALVYSGLIIEPMCVALQILRVNSLTTYVQQHFKSAIGHSLSVHFCGFMGFLRKFWMVGGLGFTKVASILLHFNAVWICSWILSEMCDCELVFHWSSSFSLHCRFAKCCSYCWGACLLIVVIIDSRRKVYCSRVFFCTHCWSLPFWLQKDGVMWH